MVFPRTSRRRRIAQVAFVAALLLLGARTCQTETVSATLEFDGGQRAEQVTSLRVDAFRAGSGEAIGFFTGNGQGPGQSLGSWELRADPGTYELRIEITTATGMRVSERTVEIQDRARIVVRLERAIPPPE